MATPGLHASTPSLPPCKWDPDQAHGSIPEGQHVPCPSQAALAAPERPRPASPSGSRGQVPETVPAGLPGGEESLPPPTERAQARPESRSPCHLRRRGMFSTEPGAGPWTRFPQVLLGSSPGKGALQSCGTFRAGTFRSRGTLPAGPLRRLHTRHQGTSVGVAPSSVLGSTLALP